MSTEGIELPRAPSAVRIRPAQRGGADQLRQEILERLVAEAREEGRRAGERQALENAAQALREAAARVDAAREEAAEKVASAAARLGVEIASHLLRSEVEAGHYDIERLVRDTLHASGVGRNACTVHLNPADLATLEGVPFRGGTELESDVEVPRGHVHVTTGHGLLVHEFESAVAAIAERILGDLR